MIWRRNKNMMIYFLLLMITILL